MSKLGALTGFVRDGRDYFGVASRGISVMETRSQAQLDLAADSWRREILSSDLRLQDSRSVNHYEHRLFSQDGTDGILREIFRRIGEGHRYFVEFGAGDGVENNTAALLMQGWSGTWIDGNEQHVGRMQKDYAALIQDNRLKLLHRFITAENIQELFVEAGVPNEPSVLSIDLDGNDYWVWRALDAYRPRVVILEYNAAFPPDLPWIMKYDPAHIYGGDAYHGASLFSLAELATAKGYRLVGCSLAGVNSFFVREDLVGDKFVDSTDPATFYHPLRLGLLAESVGHQRVVKLVTGCVVADDASGTQG